MRTSTTHGEPHDEDARRGSHARQPDPLGVARQNNLRPTRQRTVVTAITEGFAVSNRPERGTPSHRREAMLRTAERRRSWKSRPSKPAAVHAFCQDMRKERSGLPFRWKTKRRAVGR